MKRGLLCILFVVLLTVNVSAIVVSESTPVVLINEDFSKFVEGAETAPTEQDLADESTGAIDANIPNKRAGLVWVFFRLGEFVR